MTAATGAIVVDVGAGDAEPVRMRDLLDSIVRLEPGCTHVIAVNDPAIGQTRDLAAEIDFEMPAGRELVILDHPGHTQREGWSSGLAMGLLTGMAWAEANTGVDLIVKVDTDSLVTGPFVDRLSIKFDGDDRLGMLGSAYKTYGGEARYTGSWNWWEKRIHNMLRPIWIRHKRETGWLQSVRLGWSASGRYVRRMIKLALSNPEYDAPLNCQGGGYAVHRRMLSSLREHGDFDRITDWSGTFLAEDVLLGVIAGARRFGLADAVGPGEVFGIDWKGLPAEPDELLTSGCAIVHSLRQHKTASEDELRAIFRTARDQTSGVG